MPCIWLKHATVVRLNWHNLLAVIVVLNATLAQAIGNDSSKESPTHPALGQKIPEFKLPDHQGALHGLPDTAERPIAVVAFLGTDCPLARRYAARLAELATKYDPRGVAFLAVDSNRQDGLADLAAFRKTQELNFPLLKDVANEVADLFAAERTPEVFVLDRERTVRYVGRIDDQFGVGVSRPSATRDDLGSALDELLDGKDVSQPALPAAGCRIGRVRRASSGEITYNRHVAAILQKNCVECHRPGEVAPFSLTSYEDAAGWAEALAEAVSADRMPPWHANPEFGHFSNDRRLPPADRETLLAWVAGGAPEGEPADRPPPPAFLEGWRIPQPDLVLSMPHAYEVPAEGVVPYQNFELDYDIEEDMWVRAAEARPGNREIVHHMILFFVREGEQLANEAALFNIIAAFAPGMPAWTAVDGIAKRVPAGSKLYLQLHYTPNGKAQADLSTAGIVLADRATIKKQTQSHAVLNFQFRIPPGDPNYTIQASQTLPQTIDLLSLAPHMHLRGKSFRFEAISKDGQREVLLDVPRYEFHWQHVYFLEKPLRLLEGTTILCTATYDNSADNLSNPDPTRDVYWGDQTWEEMCVGQFEAMLVEEDLSQPGPIVKSQDGEQFEVVFSYRPSDPVQAVYLAGTFNEWKPDALKMDGPDAEGRYSTRVSLAPGVHEYKFVLDAKTWRADPANPVQVGFYHNSLLYLPPATP